MANANCNGDRFEASGEKLYRCFWDGAIQPTIADGDECPNCKRPVAATDHGLCETRTVIRAVVPGVGEFDLPSNDTNGRRERVANDALFGSWFPMETAPMDGREILCVNEYGTIKVCSPKTFPRPIHPDGGDMTVPRKGDRWEYFRDDENAPGHTWSMIPTHWMPLPSLPNACVSDGANH